MIRRLLASWNQLSRYQKSLHLFRLEISLLDILLGILTYYVPTVSGTFLEIQNGFPFGTHGFALFTIFIAITIIPLRKVTLLRLFYTAIPFLLFIFFNIISGVTPILAVINIIIVMFILTVYWGYTE